MTCFNCGKPCHISTQCQKPRKAPHVARASGKVFALSGVEVSKSNNLIRGTYFINGISLVVIIDKGRTHPFILSGQVEFYSVSYEEKYGH